MTTPTYYPIQKRWRRLRPLYERQEILELMHAEMEAYAFSKAAGHGLKHKPLPFHENLRPADYESTDWRLYRGKPGPQPAYWRWVCHTACHWLATHNMIVISNLEPQHDWRIITSDKHSTVVDLERKLLFDTNFQAMGIPAEECWELCFDEPSSELLEPDTMMIHHDL